MPIRSSSPVWKAVDAVAIDKVFDSETSVLSAPSSWFSKTSDVASELIADSTAVVFAVAVLWVSLLTEPSPGLATIDSDTCASVPSTVALPPPPKPPVRHAATGSTTTATVLPIASIRIVALIPRADPMTTVTGSAPAIVTTATSVSGRYPAPSCWVGPTRIRSLGPRRPRLARR